MSAKRQDLDRIALRLASWLAVQLPSHQEERRRFWMDARGVARRAVVMLGTLEVQEIVSRDPDGDAVTDEAAE